MFQPIQQYNIYNPYAKAYCNQPQNTAPISIQMPAGQRNYILVDPIKVDAFVKQKENVLPYIADVLTHSNNEAQITENLYILDRLIENGTQGADKLYPVLSRFNGTNSPNIQTFLAGIYRKIQVPDAFGPLIAMLIRNSVNPPQSNFDPNEEVGGAILAYLSDRFRPQCQNTNVTNS